MTGLFDWLAKFLDFFWQFVPRPTLVDPNCKALRVRTIRFRDLLRFRWDPTAKPEVMEPGFHLYWPVVTVWTEYPAAEQTLPVISVQFETTEAEGVRPVTVSASAILKYEVVDLIKLLCHKFDADDGISDVAQAALLKALADRPYGELRKGLRRTLNTRLKNEAQTDLEEFGVRVTRFSLNSLTPIRVFRLIQSNRQEGELK